MVQMTSDIALSGVACTSGVTPRQLVQSSSEKGSPRFQCNK
nr:NTP-binding protein [Pseudomonas aeruginosa]